MPQINSKENQSCWNCASWQPYSRSDQSPPDKENGECRFEPQIGRLEDGDDKWNQYWPYILFGTSFWCSKWKRTQLPIVDIPGQFSGQVWPDDFTTFHASPWNVRSPLFESCWNCNHYQRAYATPLQAGQNTGECRKCPPPAVAYLALNAGNPTFESWKFVYEGSDFCCSCWERNQGTVPDDPGPGA
jgi:hypothetical protein